MVLSDAQTMWLCKLAVRPNAVDRMPQRTYDALVRQELITAGGGELTSTGRELAERKCREELIDRFGSDDE